VLGVEQQSLLQFNLFTYALNDPVNRDDPSGYLSEGLREFGRGVGDGFVGFFESVATAIRHPIQTARAVIDNPPPVYEIVTTVVLGPALGPVMIRNYHLISNVARGDFYSAGRIIGGIGGEVTLNAVALGVGAGAARVVQAAPRITQVGRLPAVNRAGPGHFGVQYSTRTASGNVRLRSIEVHPPHRSGPHQFWHLQRNRWNPRTNSSTPDARWSMPWHR